MSATGRRRDDHATASPTKADVPAAHLLRAHLAISPVQLIGFGPNAAAMPTFNDYIDRVSAAVLAERNLALKNASMQAAVCMGVSGIVNGSSGAIGVSTNRMRGRPDAARRP